MKCLYWLAGCLTVLAGNPRAWPPKFVGNVTCDYPTDYNFRTSSIVFLPLGTINTLYYTSVGVDASPETGTVTGIFGSFYANNIPIINNPPTAFVTSYDIASGWAGGGNPLTANVSAAVSFLGIEFQSISGSLGGEPAGSVDLDSLVWSPAGGVTRDGDLAYVTIFGSRGDSLKVTFDLCISDVLGQLNWGADIAPNGFKSRISVTGFPKPIDELTVTMVLATATVDAAVNAQVSASGTHRLVRRGSKRMSRSLYFEGSAEVSCDGQTKAVEISIGAGTLTDITGANLRAQVTQATFDHHTDIQVVNCTFKAGQAADEWIWDPTVASGVPPEVGPKPGLTGWEIFGIVMAALVGVALLGAAVWCFLRKRVRKPENTALAADGQKTYV